MVDRHSASSSGGPAISWTEIRGSLRVSWCLIPVMEEISYKLHKFWIDWNHSNETKHPGYVHNVFTDLLLFSITDQGNCLLSHKCKSFICTYYISVLYLEKYTWTMFYMKFSHPTKSKKWKRSKFQLIIYKMLINDKLTLLIITQKHLREITFNIIWKPRFY